MPLFEDRLYVGKTFDELSIEKVLVKNVQFQQCTFKQCKLTEATFQKVHFSECNFDSSDLSLSIFPGCTFSEVSFKDSKLLGINWTKVAWPQIKLSCPLYFYSSNLSHSSFYGVVLRDILIESCKAHDVDFREADLSHASFVDTDLENSLFIHTNLTSADFTNAINYYVNPYENTVTKARFSYPDVMTLLRPLNIHINGWPLDGIE